jgi:hypothetical protein
MADRKTMTIQVDVPPRLYRFSQNRSVGLALGACTGVSITLCPLLLFQLGRSGASYGDWRVIACLIVTFVVPFTDMRLGASIFNHAQRKRAKA